MTVKQTAYPALAHKHSGSDLVGMDTTRIFASVRLNSAVNAVYNADSYATNGWVEETDVYDIVKKPGDVPSSPNDAFTRIVIPRTGWYELKFSAMTNASVGTSNAIKITLAGPVLTNSIATDTKYIDAGVEGNMKCSAVVYLEATKIVYWNWWTNQNTPSTPPQLLPAYFGGIRTRITIEWIGE